MKSTQRTAPLRVMPCLESHFHVLANAEHVKQNCQLFNMNRRMYGVTWGVDRGRLSLGQIGGTTLMWVCGPAELSKVHWVICENPPPPPLTQPAQPHLQPHHSFVFPLPPSSEPLWTLYVLLHFPLWHTHPLTSSLLHTYINKAMCTHACTCESSHNDMQASSLCLLTKQELAALVTDNKVVNGWFWRNSVVAVSQEWHYSFTQWILKVPLSWVSSRRHTIASLITLSSEKREVNGWHFATPWVLLPITIETQIRPN